MKISQIVIIHVNVSRMISRRHKQIFDQIVPYRFLVSHNKKHIFPELHEHHMKYQQFRHLHLQPIIDEHIQLLYRIQHEKIIIVQISSQVSHVMFTNKIMFFFLSPNIKMKRKAQNRTLSSY